MREPVPRKSISAAPLHSSCSKAFTSALRSCLMERHVLPKPQWFILPLFDSEVRRAAAHQKRYAISSQARATKNYDSAVACTRERSVLRHREMTGVIRKPRRAVLHVRLSLQSTARFLARSVRSCDVVCGRSAAFSLEFPGDYAERTFAKRRPGA